MSEAVFLRVLEPPPEAKGRELSRLAARHRDGANSDAADLTFLVDPADFSVVPESPFAYWVDEPVRRIFREFPPLEGNVGTVKQGLATADDFRFVRAWWEVDPKRIGFSPEDTEGGRGWIHFAKGGAYSPYYADVHLVVNWFGRGAEIKNFYKPDGRLASRPQNEDFYFRPGLTFPRRTHRLAPSALPDCCVFSHGGQAAFAQAGVEASALIALLASLPFFALLRTQLPRLDADPQFEVGQIRRTPAPPPKDLAGVSSLGIAAVEQSRQWARTDETYHPFQHPDHRLYRSSVELNHIQRQIDTTIFSAYRVPDGARNAIRREILGTEPTAPKSGVGAETSLGDEQKLSTEDRVEGVANLLMWCVGVAFGRWDVRMASDPSLIPDLQGPFERLPRVAPGGLVGPEGLPATRNQIASEAWLRARPNVITLPEPGSWDGPDRITAADYMIDVAWDGILVDDPGHPRDIVGKVREVLRYVYGGDRAQAIEDEALEILRADGRTPRSLRDWFRNQKATELGLSFFDFHIRRYSKSRRKAPIYWRLCTSPGRGQSGYGVWLYYHRLTDDTLWTVLNEYVGPRRAREERRAEELRQRIEGADGSDETRGLENEREEAVALLEEVRWFEDEIRKVGEGGWAPDLDDGVVINLAPLHAVVPWKEPEKVWEKLERGDYDWAHLAMRYWPDRVREKCRSDKSLAIAHRLEDSYEGDD